MISVSVKGDKVVDHYGFINLNFQTSDLTMGSNKDHSGILDSHSSIDEYEPFDDDYYDEDEEIDEIHTNPTTGSFNTDSSSSKNLNNINSRPTHEDISPSSTTTTLTTTTNGEGSSDNFLRFVKKLTNITRETGQEIRLGCEAEGSPPPKNIRWLKNGAPGQFGGSRFRIKSSRKKITEFKKSPVKVTSTLRITNLEVLDKGFYTCEAFNRNGLKILSVGILDVLHDAGLDVGVLPDYPNAFETFPEIGEAGNVHRIDSFHRVPLLGGNTDVLNAGNGKQTNLQPPKDGHGFCQMYKGTACKKYIGNRTIYVHSDESQFELETTLKDALKLIQLSPGISERCSRYGAQALCLYTFPLCPLNSISISPKTIAPNRLCREDCELLELDICRHEYDFAKRHHIRGQLPMPQCTELPPLGSHESKECSSIIKLQSEESKHLVLEYQSCYQDKGQDYRGTMRYSSSGQKCMAWSKQNKFKILQNPELMGGHNFCRNPGGIEPSPWCYTNLERSTKESCKLEQCGLFGYDDKVWMSISGGIAALVLILLGMLICCCCNKRRKRSKKSPIIGMVGSIGSSSRASNQLEMNSLLKKIGQPYKIPEIPATHVKCFVELGQGAFGKVYQGEAIIGDNPVRILAKTLNTSATAKTRQDFFRELELMSELKHPNILCLLGVVTGDNPRALLYEYMTQGDLHEFLINHSPRCHAEYILEPNEMLFIATQISAGMEYLAAHHYVHRDLAARNALVGEGLTVKISDYGLSREIYASEYSNIRSKSLLPIRWMAPESLMYGKFSTESDVWSFGVVLYEIYSFGLQPYKGYNIQEVVDLVRTRQLLTCPDLCPPRMYSLMLECWAELSHRRPSFEELHRRLKQLLLPLLGPNSNFSPHIHLMNSGNPYAYPFAPPSCASNNSMSSHQSSNTGPLSNNTNSTNVSNPQWSQQQQQQQQQRSHQTFLPNPNNNAGPHCVAYQSTPVVNCQGQGAGSNGNGSIGGFSPHQTLNATAQFHTGTGRISHSHSPHNGGGNILHSPSPYRVLMESKSTNI